MNQMPFRLAAILLAAGSANLLAQSNVVPGLALALEDTWDLRMFTRGGTYPNGVGAVGAWTTICNPGNVAVPFQAAMSPNHAFIHYMVCSYKNGRLVQISNRGHVKHTFGSSNDASSCGSCAGPGRLAFVEIGCSDTYASVQACDHFNLGPPDEVNPWLGSWNPVCSLFDRGDPAVSPSQTCDGNRSLTQQQANALNATIHNQNVLRDADLLVPGAVFFYSSGYIVPGEAGNTRGDNLGSRQVVAAWNPVDQKWDFTDGPNYLPGSILWRWLGAQVTSATNGNDDGRFYVACVVTGPVNGIYHYEYGVHNYDNNRGLGALRLPVCPTAHVTNIGFRDIDQDPLNDWTGSKVGSEIVFTAGSTQNPLRWNSMFNFWFDCDAAPADTQLALDQFDIGPGAASVLVSSRSPGGYYNVDLGPGCGSPTAPTMFVTGAPARATLGNPTFGLEVTGNQAGSWVAIAYGFTPGTTVVAPGCTVYTGDIGNVAFLGYSLADNNGRATMSQPVPNDPALEGRDFDLQAGNLASGGLWLGGVNLSNGVRVRVGSAITRCP